LECGDWSPLLLPAGLRARQSLVQRLGKTPRPSPLDGDKSPAQSGENSPHSIALRLRLRRGRETEEAEEQDAREHDEEK
jgi:hypothetical protein